ncbi:MAG: endonuclease III domain-containing protein [Terriglobia bacterium]
MTHRERAGPGPRGDLVKDYYESLLRRFGRQRWWPARTRLEVILGAILTQNTSWRNAALALKALRAQGLLRIDGLRTVAIRDLETLVRPAGFYRQKAAAIRGFVDYVDLNCGGSLSTLFAAPEIELRQRLLSLRGLGPETADAILLYAGRKAFFVADTYTRRILSRHAWLPPDASYEAAQQLLHERLPRDPVLFNEFHALLVETGKRYCTRRAPACLECPLRPYLPAPSRPSVAKAMS